MKTYIIILDGAADRPNEFLNNKTPLAVANTPALSYLAQNGSMSMIDIIGNDIVPESDSGTMALLSYNPLDFYPGRGALEGIGIGCAQENSSSIAFRINFASFDKDTGYFFDRTVKELTSKELKILTEDINKNIHLDEFGVQFNLVTFEHHRGVLCLYSKNVKLSSNVSNTDPAFKKKGVWRENLLTYNNAPQLCKPLDDSIESITTAKIINDFSKKIHDFLDTHPINKKRLNNGLKPANYFVIRDGGNCSANLPKFRDRFNHSLRIIGQLPAEKAIAILIGENFEYSNPLDEDLDEASLMSLSQKILSANEDIIYSHIKGPDEFGHENKPIEKVRSIEKIDKYFIQPLIEKISPSDVVVVTCDHATPCNIGKHTSDLVPLLISGTFIVPDGLNHFDEDNAKKGSLKVKKAIDLIPYLFENHTFK